jgi:hypothetical protein
MIFASMMRQPKTVLSFIFPTTLPYWFTAKNGLKNGLQAIQHRHDESALWPVDKSPTRELLVNQLSGYLVSTLKLSLSKPTWTE